MCTLLILVTLILAVTNSKVFGSEDLNLLTLATSTCPYAFNVEEGELCIWIGDSKVIGDKNVTLQANTFPLEDMQRQQIKVRYVNNFLLFFVFFDFSHYHDYH